MVGSRFSSKEQASFNFMAVVTSHNDFGAQEKRSLTVSIVSPSICHEVMGLDAMILVFQMLSFNVTWFGTLPLMLQYEFRIFNIYHEHVCSVSCVQLYDAYGILLANILE